MTFEEFNDKRQKLKLKESEVVITKSPEAISDLVMCAALEGLIYKDVSEGDGEFMPTPICAFFVFLGKDSMPVSMYVYPADQHTS